jgi:hypothetical protein
MDGWRKEEIERKAEEEETKGHTVPHRELPSDRLDDSVGNRRFDSSGERYRDMLRLLKLATRSYALSPAQ